MIVPQFDSPQRMSQLVVFVVKKKRTAWRIASFASFPMLSEAR